MTSYRRRSFALFAFVTITTALVACSGEDDGHKPGLRLPGTTADEENATEPTQTASSGTDAGSSTSTPTGDAGTKDSGTGTNEPEYEGEATYYDADGTGACGFPASTNFYVAAINDEQYSKANCGKCVDVEGPKGNVVVRIVDKCPGCKEGDLDLSMTAFSKIANLSDGRIDISWHFTPCP